MSARSASRWELTDTYSPVGIDIARATSPASPATRTTLRDAATPPPRSPGSPWTRSRRRRPGPRLAPTGPLASMPLRVRRRPPPRGCHPPAGHRRAPSSRCSSSRGITSRRRCASPISAAANLTAAQVASPNTSAVDSDTSRHPPSSSATSSRSPVIERSLGHSSSYPVFHSTRAQSCRPCAQLKPVGCRSLSSLGRTTTRRSIGTLALIGAVGAGHRSRRQGQTRLGEAGCRPRSPRRVGVHRRAAARHFNPRLKSWSETTQAVKGSETTSYLAGAGSRGLPGVPARAYDPCAL